MIAVDASGFASWRLCARTLLQRGVPPDGVVWGDGQQTSLFAGHADVATEGGAAQPAFRVPPRFLADAEIACDHSAPERFAVLYALLWKLAHGNAHVLDDPLDRDAVRLAALVREVHAEEHRMHAFVRFRPLRGSDGLEAWVAWYQPSHRVLARVAPFFARRYPKMRWAILTPDASAYWDTHEIAHGPGVAGDTATADELDRLFLVYYENVFNPARTNTALLHKHLPRRVLSQLPERGAISGLVRQAGERVNGMGAARVSASEAYLPPSRDLPSLRAAARGCRACPIGEHATQAVFGEGPVQARLMVVGEQPGDEEDQSGRPFVGPAGRLLDELLQETGLARPSVYVTNAVKHFKWEPRGKRRLHAKPNQAEIGACAGWLLAEVATIGPAMILCLGATAAQSFCGAGFRVQRDRGKPMSTPWAPWFMATYHPSALLRAPDEALRRTMRAQLLDDLALTAAHLRELERRPEQTAALAPLTSS